MKIKTIIVLLANMAHRMRIRVLLMGFVLNLAMVIKIPKIIEKYISSLIISGKATLKLHKN